MQQSKLGKIGIEPVEFKLRNQLGKALEKEEVKDVKKYVEELFKNRNTYRQKIDKIYDEFLYNHGIASEKGANYILKSLVEKKNNKK